MFRIKGYRSVTFGCAESRYAHAKNYSILYGPDGRGRLAPLYDLVCTVYYPEIDNKRTSACMCANEVEIGMVIPNPELALFRHKLPMNVFFQTVQLARRWTGPDALAAGIVEGFG